MEKEIKIVPPEGYEIDKEHSTFECIKFKEKAKLNVITSRNSRGLYCEDVSINNHWAFTIMKTESEGNGYGVGLEKTGHKASLFLVDSSDNRWFDENGNMIRGYLFYGPNK